MGLYQVLRFIVTHPMNKDAKSRAVLRFLKWQVRTLLRRERVVFEWVNGTSIIVGRGEAGLTGNIYCGLHEFNEMAFLLHFLRADDFFVDVGANAGAYTILAGGAVGAAGIALEPVPSAFSRLTTNVQANRLSERVTCLNLGVGNRETELKFTSTLDCINHVVLDGKASEDLIEVSVNRLDTILGDRRPSLIKIDVEGYETPVLQGAERTMTQKELLAVIMELNGSGERYGYDEEVLNRMMLDLGFSTLSYDPFQRLLIALNGKRDIRQGNELYLRDIGSVRERVASAPKFSVQGRLI